MRTGQWTQTTGVAAHGGALDRTIRGTMAIGIMAGTVAPITILQVVWLLGDW